MKLKEIIMKEQYTGMGSVHLLIDGTRQLMGLNVQEWIILKCSLE
jgi:hypothetical protein